MSDQGLILVYTGNGKGKTTAALGLGLRASGHGQKVMMIQFMKGQTETGELVALEQIDHFTIEQAGRANFVNAVAPDPMDISAAQAGLARAATILEQGCDLLILDEINVAMDYGLVEIEDVKELLLSKPPHTSIVMTGRGFPLELADEVDLISEVQEVKHHFNRGVLAKKGIEY